MAGWGNDDEVIDDDGGSWGADDALVSAPRRGGTSGELRRAAGSVDPAARPLPAGVKPSAAGAGRGSVNPQHASVERADAPFRDRRAAIDDAVDRIELGAPAEDVFTRFERAGIPRAEIVARGQQLGGKAFAPQAAVPVDRDPLAPPAQDRVTAVEPGTAEGIANFGRRVAERGSQAATGAMASLGVIPEDSAAASLAASQRRMNAAAPGSEIQRGMEAFSQVKTFGQAFRAIADHPGAAAAVVAESAALILPVMAAASVAGLPAVGTAVVAGGTSAALEFGSVLTDELGEKGIDPRNVEAVGQALRDPEFMRAVRTKGVLRGLTVGSMDALTAGLAGRFIEPVIDAARAGRITAPQATRQAAAAASKELSMQMAGGAGGEQLAQILTGDDKPFDVVAEALGEVAGAPLEATSNIRGARREAGALTPGAQFEQAFGDDVAATSFDPAAVDGFARRAATDPRFFDPAYVDPQSTAREPGAPAAPTIRVEDMPTMPISVEEAAALSAQVRARAAAKEVDSDPAAAAPTGDSALGVARVPQGTLAAAADLTLVKNAQAAASENRGPNERVSVPSPALAPERSGAGGGDLDGSLAGAGPGAAVAARRPDPAAAPEPRSAAPASARGANPGSEALNVAPLPERPQGRAAADARSDEAIRAEHAAAYDRDRATYQRTAESLRQRAAGLRAANNPELTTEATRLEQRADIEAALADESPVMDAPPAKEAASFGRLQSAIKDTFGRRVVAYFDQREQASDGFLDQGVVFLNLARPERSVAFTAFHELQHVVRREGQAGNAQSQLATQMLDQVWGMIDEAAKVQYAKKYLFRRAIDGGRMTLDQALADPLLRDEMLSDFMGKRAIDERWLRGLARQHPEQFGSFVSRWIDALKRLIDSLRGNREGGVKDVDKAIRDLDRARQVAERVLRAWADSNPERAQQQGVAPQPEAEPAAAPAPAPAAPEPRVNSMRERDIEKADKAVRASSVDALMGDDIEVETIVADDFFGDDKPLSKAEMEEINAELQEQQGWASEAPLTNYEAPSDQALKDAGIMAESAYKPLDYTRTDATIQGASIAFSTPWAVEPRRTYHFQLWNNDQGASAIPEDERMGSGAALGLRYVSEGLARAYNTRVAASIDLERRGFDLYTAVPAAARTRVEKAWKSVADMKGAFEFKRGDPSAYKGKPPVEMLQVVADDLLAGSRFNATASKETGSKANWYNLIIAETRADGTISESHGEIEYQGGAERRLIVHASFLNKGSGAGKALYQIAFAWSHALGIPTNADKQGLTSVNTYRRTEQMMAAAARAGAPGAANPGVGQRVYGWNSRAKDATQKGRNLVRLALASARNAAELVPRVSDMAYDLANDAFTWRRGAEKGKPAEDFVREVLATKDARTLSVSRSTLARAAVTLAAVDGDLQLDESKPVKAPILYSARSGGAEYAELGDPLAGDYKRLEGRQLSYQVLVQDTGRMATLRGDAAQMLRDIDRRLDALRKVAKCLER